ncbi:hypothetical protein SHKM778_02670 [Streptomyces sp. KM77-8]|uniref:Serine/threonine protein kinase n=1 Tax=Streptomyces haneummycinicus TaxID=3074435 RepID=A0AAT9H960_9ACTN
MPRPGPGAGTVRAPQPPAYGHPYSGGHGAGQTPAYGPPPYVPAAPAPLRDSRSTVLLVAIALVVALAAGGTVYALMNGGDTGHRAGGDPTPPPTSAGAPESTAPDDPSPADRPSTSAPADGTVPAGYLGQWSTTIDNASGEHTRTLTIQQGKVGDTVMSLVADGPAGSGTYHCVFEARLTADPGSGDRLELGASSVTVGEPRSSCTPGAASTITLLSGDSLQRVTTGTGEQLTYTRD